MAGISIYKIVKKKPVLTDYIKSNEEINEETIAKIREKYSLDNELKILRTAKTNTTAFTTYNNYIEQCQTEGEIKKQFAIGKVATLKKKTLTENKEKRIIYVES